MYPSAALRPAFPGGAGWALLRTASFLSGQMKGALTEIIQLATLDSDPWVLMVADILKSFPDTGSLNLDLEEQNPNVQDILGELREKGTCAGLVCAGGREMASKEKIIFPKKNLAFKVSPWGLASFRAEEKDFRTTGRPCAPTPALVFLKLPTHFSCSCALSPRSSRPGRCRPGCVVERRLCALAWRARTEVCKKLHSSFVQNGNRKPLRKYLQMSERAYKGEAPCSSQTPSPSWGNWSWQPSAMEAVSP